MAQPYGDARDIGRRVRVRLVPGRVCEDAPHQAVQDGQTGTIVRYDAHGRRAHPILVQYDQTLHWPIAVHGTRSVVPLLVRWYRADELELLD